MAASEKLYPPIISSSLPAFYSENGTAVTIAVPFSMNKAVNSTEIAGFYLKIKTSQTNQEIITLDLNDVNNLDKIIQEGILYFNVNNCVYINQQSKQNNLILNDYTIPSGTFLKVQLAYKMLNNNPGYYSSSSITRYVDKPNVYIKTFRADVCRINFFQQTCTGIYDLSAAANKTEKPYSYNFYLYDKNKQLIEESGLLYHKNIEDENDIYYDKYTFKTILQENVEYYVQYNVTTMNNLTISTPLYNCIEYSAGSSTDLEGFNLKGQNNFDNAYIKLSFELNDNYTFLTKFKDFVNDIFIKNGYAIKKQIDISGSLYALFLSQDETPPRIIIGLMSDENNSSYYEVNYYDENNKLIKIEEWNIINSQKIFNKTIEILRSEDLISWKKIQTIYFNSYKELLNWEFKDFSIEQGKTYQYCFREYNKEENLYCDKVYSESIFADFEDMFLWDGKKQLKIRFNPKVSSFKINRLETKTDTIGGKYPFFFRNGDVEYKEFPISGLISYQMDENQQFINYENDLGLATAGQMLPRSSGAQSQIYKAPTVNLLDYNMKAEREFKLRVLEWLGDGKPKLFKSPAEGNYLVRLMNISLSPEDRLSRMLHSFSCTAYEAETFNFDNLIKLGFIQSENEQKEIQESLLKVETVKLKDKFDYTDLNNFKDFLIKQIKINNYKPIQYLKITSLSTKNLILSIGENNNIIISPYEELIIQTKSLEEISDIYFSFLDNSEYSKNFIEYTFEYAETEVRTLNELKNETLNLIGDTFITYYYKEEIIPEESLIKEVYLQKLYQVRTLKGEEVQESIISSNNINYEIINFYINDLRRKNNNSDDDIKVKLITENNQVYQFDLNTLPAIDIFSQPYKNIELDTNVVADVILYLSKVIEYKE